MLRHFKPPYLDSNPCVPTNDIKSPEDFGW